MLPTLALRSVSRSSSVGFIGVGLMGKEMFRNLIQNTQSLPSAPSPDAYLPGVHKPSSYVVCDVAEKNVLDFLAIMKELGVEGGKGEGMIQVAKDPHHLTLLSSTLISMIPTSAHVRSVYTSPSHQSVLSALKSSKLSETEVKATLCCDESTIEMEATQAVGKEIEAAGASYVDAPVSGGVVGAKNATLTIMVGASSDGVYDRAAPILGTMGKKVLRCGDLGAGLAAKICNNMMLGISMLGLAEAMLLGKKLGLDLQLLGDIINTSTGQSWASSVNFPVGSVQIGTSTPPSQRSYSGGFVSKLAHKDLALAVAAGKSVGAPLQVGGLTEEVYRRMMEQKKGYGDRDFGVVYKWLEEGGK